MRKEDAPRAAQESSGLLLTATTLTSATRRVVDTFRHHFHCMKRMFYASLGHISYAPVFHMRHVVRHTSPSLLLDSTYCPCFLFSSLGFLALLCIHCIIPAPLSHPHTHTLSLYYPHPALLPLSISLFLFALVPPLTSNKLHSHVPTCAFHLSLLHLPRNVSIFAPKPSCGQRQSTNAIIGHPNPRHHLRPSKPDTAALRGFGSCDAFYRCP